MCAYTCRDLDVLKVFFFPRFVVPFPPTLALFLLHKFKESVNGEMQMGKSERKILTDGQTDGQEGQQTEWQSVYLSVRHRQSEPWTKAECE